MTTSRVAHPYAVALFKETVSQQNLQIVFDDIKSLQKSFAGSSDLKELLQNPTINSTKKNSAVLAIFGNNIAPLTMNFLQLLIQKHRANELECIFDIFETLYNEQNGLVPVQIVSAMELIPTQKEALLTKVSGYAGGKKIIPNYHIDSSLIGGMTIRIGDVMLDGSIKRQLELLQLSLIG